MNNEGLNTSSWFKYFLWGLLAVPILFLVYQIGILNSNSDSGARQEANFSSTPTVSASDLDFIKRNEKDAIMSEMVLNSAITSIKLADNSVTSAKILNGTIVSGHIQDGAVLEINIADGAVTTAKLANDLATDIRLANGSISLSRLSSSMCSDRETLVKDGSVWTCGLAYDEDIAGEGLKNEDQVLSVETDGETIEIVSNKLQLVDGSVTNVKLADGSVTVSKISDGSVSNGKLANNSVSTDKVLNSTLLFEDLANNGCLDGDVIKMTGSTWDCGLDTGGSVTEAQIEAFIFDGDNTGTLSSGTLSLSALSFLGVLTDVNISDTLTVSASGSVADGALSVNVTKLGSSIDLTSEVGGILPLSAGGTGVNLVDPNNDRVLFWDDSAGAFTWLTMGTNLAISGTTLNAADQFTGTVTSVGSGNGLTGGAITSTGSLSVSSPTCSGTDKLQWNGSAFVCATDQIGTQPTESEIEAFIFDGDNTGTLASGTLDFSALGYLGTLSDTNISDVLTISASGSVADGALSANVTKLGSSIDLTSEIGGILPMASGGTGANLVDPNNDRVLFWDDSAGAFTFLTMGTNLSISGTTLNATDQIGSAGNDLDLTGSTFDIESQLDSVSIISRASSDLTLQTTTSGNILINPAGDAAVGGSVASGVKLNVVGRVRMTEFQLGTSSTSGHVLTADSSGVGTWQVLPVKTVYQNTTTKTGVKIWTGTGTTAGGGGVATIFLTSDGTGGGTALFTNVYSINATGQFDTTDIDLVPIASVKAISGDKKTLTINVVESRSVALTNPSLEFADNGRVVYVTVIGD